MVGLATNWSSISATRTQPIGPFHGISEMARAALAPLTIAMSEPLTKSAATTAAHAGQGSVAFQSLRISSRDISDCGPNPSWGGKRKCPGGLLRERKQRAARRWAALRESGLLAQV